MVDPGFLPGVIGVGIQMLVNKMIEWIKRAARCKKELDELKHLLRFNLSIYAEMRINANRIGSLPSSVDGWLTELKDILQKGSQFVEACTVPPRWQLIPRGKLTKEITRFTSDLREHLASNSLIISLQQLHIEVAFREAIEQLRQDVDSLKQRTPASASPRELFRICVERLKCIIQKLFSSSMKNDVQHSLSSSLSYDALADDISLQLCFLRLATFPEEQDIRTAVATDYWIKEGLVAGPDHLRTGQRYVNLLADRRLIEPLSEDDNGDVYVFRMPNDFQDLAHQIVEEEERLLRTVRGSQEFSYEERLNAVVKVLIKRGTNLAVRDTYWKKRSDPYVVAILNDQKRETRVIRKNLNPVWNEELSLPVLQPQPLLKLKVFDKDRLSRDDKMGYGEVDLNNLAMAARILRTSQSPSFATMNTKGSRIECVDGQMVQKVCLKLEKVESGELYLDIKWVETQDSFPHF